jgi:hypothetical protein
VFVAYRNIRFASGCTTWRRSARTSKNPAGYPVETTHRVECEGELLGVDTADILRQSAAAETAFKLWGGDLVLYTDAGGIAEALRNATSTTGVSIPEYSFPKGDGAELTTYRSFSFVAEASYPAAGGGSQSNVIAYEQRVRVSGGLPIVSVLRPKRGPMVRVFETETSEYTATQTGSAVGLVLRPTPPPPLWPQLLIGREIERTDPILTIAGPRNYGISWTYTFLSTTQPLG